MKPEFKYKIHECLEELSMKNYKIATKNMPSMIKKSMNTFWNYANIKFDDKKTDIPYCTVLHLEILFGLEHGKLLNAPVEAKSLAEIRNEILETSKI